MRLEWQHCLYMQTAVIGISGPLFLINNSFLWTLGICWFLLFIIFLLDWNVMKRNQREFREKHKIGKKWN